MICRVLARLKGFKSRCGKFNDNRAEEVWLASV